VSQYVIIADFTDKITKEIRDSSERVEAFKIAVEKVAGVKLKEVYSSIGKSDVIARVEVSDDRALSPILHLGGVRKYIVRTSLTELPKSEAAKFDAWDNTQVKGLRVWIETGGDDCRNDSTVEGYMGYLVTDSPYLFGQQLKPQGPSWENGDLHGWPEIREIDTSTILPKISELGPFTITFESHPSDFESGDNWNMQNIQVDYVTPAGNEGTLIIDSGNPLIRFYTQGKWSTSNWNI
jgi:uncharacterized protein with GYD domain